jgi:Reverse transcriptase (RNA-dependent DNA polymerase)
MMAWWQNCMWSIFRSAKSIRYCESWILLAKLVNYGVEGIVHDSFKSYLHNRQRFTKVCNVSSQLCTINFGVPQGSVLEPLLYLININDIGHAVRSEKVKLFAYDTSLFVSCSSISSVNNKVNTYMKQLNDWFVANKLSWTWVKHVAWFSRLTSAIKSK